MIRDKAEIKLQSLIMIHHHLVRDALKFRLQLLTIYNENIQATASIIRACNSSLTGEICISRLVSARLLR